MKKLLAIVMAAVLAMALGVAVYADDYSYEAAAGYTTFLNTTTDTALTTAADALGDDAVITFTFTAPQDISSYSYFELQLRDAGWAPWPNTPYDNYTLCDVKASGSNTFSITYGELKAIIEAESFDVHSMQFICNTDPNDPGPIAVAVSVAGAAAEAEPEAAPAETEAAETETTETAPETTTEETASAPSTGLAIAVVPAVVALAAAVVTKKH